MLILLLYCNINLMEVPIPDGFTKRVQSLKEGHGAIVLPALEADADEQEIKREMEKMVALLQVASTVTELARAKGIATDFVFHRTIASKTRRVSGRAFEIEPLITGWKLAESVRSSWDNDPYATQREVHTYKGIVLCIDGKPRSYSTTSEHSGADITDVNFSNVLTSDRHWKLRIALESGLARFVANNNLVLPTEPAQGESPV